MLDALIDLVRIAGALLTLLIFVRVILSWVQPAGGNRPTDLVYRFTEPLLGPVRGLLPAMGGMDFSPIIVLFGIQIVERLLVQLLLGLARGGVGN
ncbi:MAG: YggT family protein [Candidatus Lambdaproteobacteria bacterium]|nr:YggT family protein [Candidatus Lambdaproteobacteria bacterium]